MISKLNEWMLSIQIPREELGGLPICPYARQTIAQKLYDIRYTNVCDVHAVLSTVDIQRYAVTLIVVEDYLSYDENYLVNYTTTLNDEYKSKDFVILENDPRSPMIVNGVTTSFEHGYLWVVQSLNDLNQKSLELRKTEYYSYWTQQQLDDVVTWRTKQ
jgi:hypothetical protein